MKFRAILKKTKVVPRDSSQSESVKFGYSVPGIILGSNTRVLLSSAVNNNSFWKPFYLFFFFRLIYGRKLMVESV